MCQSAKVSGNTMWHRRRPLPRRRVWRRRYRPRRRFGPLRRRLWIRRPTAGGIYTERLSTSTPVTYSFTGGKNHHAFRVGFTLQEFVTVASFEYYRILKAKWHIKPATPPETWSSLGGGVTVIDLDSNELPTSLDKMPFGNNSTLRHFQPRYGTHRYFSPKPQNKSSGTESGYYPSNTRSWWWNTSLSNIDWGYVKGAFYTATPNDSLAFYETKTIWVQFKTHL